MIHVLVFVIEWSLMDTQLHDFSQQISEVVLVDGGYYDSPPVEFDRQRQEKLKNLFA